MDLFAEHSVIPTLALGHFAGGTQLYRRLLQWLAGRQQQRKKTAVSWAFRWCKIK